MKKYILILMLSVFATSIAHSQTNKDERYYTLGIYQDGRLAMFKDSKGRKPFNLDIRIEAMLQGNHTSTGFIVAGLTYEYAELNESNLNRFGVQAGYTFENLSFFNLFDVDITPMGGIGVIHRFEDDWVSLELTLEGSYRLTNWLSINIKGTKTQRGELAIYRSDASSYRPWDWKFNVYGGIKLQFK